MGVKGHPSSLAMSPFNRAHTTSYSTLIETVSILYHLRAIANYLSKVADFNLPYLHLAVPVGGAPIQILHRPLASER